MPHFDPYHTWLGISPRDQPPHHYRLLGIDLLEGELDVIENAADQRMAARSREGTDASDADPAIAAEMAESADPWPSSSVVPTDGTPAESLELAIDALTPMVPIS